ncbi:MAG: hypothetical protein ACXVZR_09375 [Terriglobales bacterium]
MKPSLRRTFLAFAAVVFLGLASLSFAQDNDEVAIGRTITVAPNETRGDIACVHCSVYVRGTVKGDVAVLDGRIVIEGVVTGDVALAWGNLRLGDGAQVGGDVAAFGGDVKRSPSASVRGDQASFPRGKLLVAAIFALACFGAVIVLIIWLFVWLFQRGRSGPAPQAAGRT